METNTGPQESKADKDPLDQQAATLIGAQSLRRFRQRNRQVGIPIVIPGHPEIHAFKYGDPDDHLIPAELIIQARKRQLGIE